MNIRNCKWKDEDGFEVPCVEQQGADDKTCSLCLHNPEYAKTLIKQVQEVEYVDE
jgi:hypothetical protein